LALFWSGYSSLLFAADQPELVERLVRLRETQLLQDATLERLKFEETFWPRAKMATASSGNSDDVDSDSLPPIVMKALQSASAQRLDALQGVVGMQMERRSIAQKHWQDLIHESIHREKRWREAEELIGVPRDCNLSWSNVLGSVDDHWPWLLLITCVSAGLWWHEKRRQVRRWKRSLSVARLPTSAALWISAVLSLSCAGCGVGLPTLIPRADWNARLQAQLADDERTLTDAIIANNAQVSEREQRVAALRPPATSAENTPRSLDGAASAEWPNVDNHVSSLLTKLLTADFETAAYERASAELSTANDATIREIQSFHARSAATALMLRTAHVGVTLGGGVLLLTPMLWSLGQGWRERRNWRRTCPRCLSENTLERITIKGSKGGQRVVSLSCHAKLPDGNMCAAEFPSDVQNLPRICFPTIGITSSGKTRWIRCAESQYALDQTYGSAQVRLLCRVDSKKGATDPSKIPLPLVLNVTDHDLIRPRGKTLLMVFDYGGEMGTHAVTTSHKQRALMMDGFIWFLDPTRVIARAEEVEKGKGQAVTLTDQINTVQTFKSDLQKFTGSGSDAVLDMPVAVCLSKLDLLANMSPLGGRAYEFLDRLRETQDAPITLDLIQERSNLCVRFIQQIFLDWNVERFLRTNFGERFMFFPLTPINILETELNRNDQDVEGRTPRPYGVQEPIWWLLHMYGYKVL